MPTVKTMLDPFIFRAFARSQPPSMKSSAMKALDELYDGFNGGLFWRGALVIRPRSQAPDAPLTVTEWNRRDLWKSGYNGTADDAIFFAEDAFGCQFGIANEGIVQFDPETGTFDKIAENPVAWCRELIADAPSRTGAPVLEAWEATNGSLPVAHRLVPRQPFMLGGEFAVGNMVSKPDVEGMKIRAQLWQLTKDIPDGTDIVFKIE